MKLMKKKRIFILQAKVYSAKRCEVTDDVCIVWPNQVLYLKLIMRVIYI